MDSSRRAIEKVFREESGAILATLIRVLRDFGSAEEALQEAFVAALDQWPRDGVPRSPAAWISTTARRRALDAKRRADTARRSLGALPSSDERPCGVDDLDEPVPDDSLRLMFTCCHPALHPEAQVSLTLRTLGGLTTREIARAFLVSEATLAQRLVRAKRKIREAGIPYRVPPPELLSERLAAVLSVLYLIFNEGYSASSGDSLVRADLCHEGLRLTGVLHSLMADPPEIGGLWSLMLYLDARRPARTDSRGGPILLQDQDRSLWDRTAIERAGKLLRQCLRQQQPGPYQVQAAIAACHAESPTYATTPWRHIVRLYDLLYRLLPTDVVLLNRAAAISMVDGPDAALQLIEPLGRVGELRDYLFFHSTRADLLRRLGRKEEAVSAYERALELAENEAQRRFLRGRRDGVD